MNLKWAKNPEIGLEDPNAHFPRWFPDGEGNITVNCLDRHVGESFVKPG
jgi:hypothetical protein